MEPCSTHTAVVHIFLGTLAALNVALGTWLAHRRYQADRREANGNGNGPHAKRGHVRGHGDDSTNHPPGIQP